MQIDSTVTERHSEAWGHPLLWAYRDKYPERLHRGAWIVCDAQGYTLYSTPGAQQANTFFRSAAKPFQALPLLAALNQAQQTLPSELLAVVCASHTGTPKHIAAVSALLEQAQLRPQALQCGAHCPLDGEARQTMQKQGLNPDPRHNNCSGKHAGMLLACILKNWTTETYLDPIHPLQQEIVQTLARYLGGEDGCSWATDGCGAPVPYLPLPAMAHLYAKLWEEQDAKPIVHAMTQNPYMMGGNGRIDSEMIALGKGRLLVKVGAEGVLCASRPAQNGQPAQGVALKILDGSESARNRVFVHLLYHLGWLDEAAFQNPQLNSWTDLRIMNTQGIAVGHYELLICLNHASSNCTELTP